MMHNQNLLDKSKLLEALDSLGYTARMGSISLLGRTYRDNPAYSALLQSLLAGGFYEAQLALTGADATGDAQAVTAALRHEAAGVRKRAVGLLAKWATPAVMEEEAVSMSKECRRQLWRGISVHGQREAAERLLPLVFARWGAQEAAALLPACGEETVYRWMRTIGYSVDNWQPIAKRYPGLVAAYFRETLAQASPKEKGNVWRRFSSAMEMLSLLQPDAVLACALEEGPQDILPPILRTYMGNFMTAHADQVHRLLVREASRSDLLSFGIPLGVLRKKKAFSLEQWGELAVILAGQPVHMARLLHTLAPSQRTAVFAAAYPEPTRQGRVWEEAILDELPHDLREQEAVRMLGLREIKNNRQESLRITARRSIRHARTALEQASRVSPADERAMGLTYLVNSTALSREGMKETLLFLTRIKNDQDPVRLAAMTALSASPAFLYSAEQLPALTLLVDSVVEARDSSYATRAATERLAFNLLRHHAAEPGNALFAFALQTLVKLVKVSGQFALPSFEHLHLPHGVEAALFDEIYTSVAGDISRENYRLVLQLARALGKRGHNLPKLQELLEEATQAKNDATATQAARYWLAPPKTRDARVRALLDRDPSFIVVEEVLLHLIHKRQEWLDLYLSGTPVKGKLLSGKTIYLLPATWDFYRWLPRQQEAFALLLTRVVRDGKRNVFERTHALRRLAQLPDVSFSPMLDLLEHKEVAIAEAALYALSLTEAPEQALPHLLDHLDGDRARVAMYAVPRCMRRMSPGLLAACLQELLDRDKLKITVRKEAIRLLGAYRSGESVSLLLRELGKPQVHKDVQIAIGHAARQLLDDERSWDLLKTLAASSERDVVNSLMTQSPEELPQDQRHRYLAFIVGLAAHADAEVRGTAYHAMNRWSEGNEAIIAGAVAEGIVDLQESVSWRMAVHTLVQIGQDGKVNAIILGVVRQLAQAPLQAEWNANVAAGRDMPQRQRLLALTGMLTMQFPLHTRLALAPLYHEIIACLAPDETLRLVVVKMQLAAIDWQQVPQAAADLRKVTSGLEQQPHLLHDVDQAAVHILHSSNGHWKPEVLLAISDELAAGGDFVAAYLALSLLEVAGKDLFWNEACAGRLRAYRKHPHMAVRTRALNIWTADE